ncbi:MAG: response regulator [Lachnospiraceae bacterium]|nr:response regulator [Lachnospiraceae bacterium]
MKLKVLVTGKNKKICRDISEHLESDRGYITIKCAPSKSALFDLILSELPKVIIICLGDETADTVKTFNVLKNVSMQGNCTIIVVTNNEDEKTFIKNTELRKFYFLSRPVALMALYEKLQQIEDELEEKGESPEFREFINEEFDEKSKKKHILVVDDDTEQLVSIKEQLEEFYNVSVVKSGDAMFKFLMKHTPDLILLDYLMPEKDGPQVLKQMRTIDEYAVIPVMFLTGMTERSTVIQTLTELRPQGYIIKPPRKSDLVAKIIEVLG